MTPVALVTALLVAAVTLLHYEALQGIHRRLGALAMPARPKVLVVMLGCFLAHVVEIGLYGGGYYALIVWLGQGNLVGAAADAQVTFDECLYFSGATYTSLGLGDLAPTGPLRLLAAAQALHGLLLIGWTASFLYISMERFWSARHGR
jgi:hypothetical protein